MFQHTKLYIFPFQNLSLGFILKIYLKFRKFQSRYSYKIYSYIYKKKSVLEVLKPRLFPMSQNMLLKCHQIESKKKNLGSFFGSVLAFIQWQKLPFCVSPKVPAPSELPLPTISSPPASFTLFSRVPAILSSPNNVILLIARRDSFPNTFSQRSQVKDWFLKPPTKTFLLVGRNAWQT